MDVVADKIDSYQICSRCVLDTTVPGIVFDEQGVCQFCKVHDELDRSYPLDANTQKELERQVAKIKKAGKGKPYDIIVGVSGGRDSSYALHQIVELGLRPLAVHFDNGWNSEIAVTNIKNVTTALGVDLYTYVVDWEEFKDLQKSFLKASVSDAEIPTDVGIHGILHRVAAKEGIKYIVFAHSFRTEGVVPLGWTYMDGRYIKDVHKKFGTKKLKTFPNMTLWDVIYFRFFRGIKNFPLMVYINYDKNQTDKFLTEHLGWKYYGGHHHESYYTHFFQSYYLPKKFNIDKRKIEYSGLISSGQMTRDEALDDLETNDYPYDKELIAYAIRKLGLSEDEFQHILQQPNKSFKDYKTYYGLIRFLKGPINIAYRLHLFPKQLFLKFLT